MQMTYAYILACGFFSFYTDFFRLRLNFDRQS